jgi:parallel beta-helix repeat protein
MFALAIKIQPARTQMGTIYINSDGSISSPVTANITTSDNITYTFTGNNYLPIVVGRSNIIINGNAHTLRASIALGTSGFSLTGMSNVTIRNTTITNNYHGVWLSSSSGIILSGNNIENNTVGINVSGDDNVLSDNNVTANSSEGIDLFNSSGNVLPGNNVTANNGDGIDFYSSDNNTLSGSNFAANIGEGIFLYESSGNVLSGNTVTANNGDGIYLRYYSSNNTLLNNKVTANSYCGILLYRSSDNVLSGNMMASNEYNFVVYGGFLNDYVEHVDASNLVDAKPVYYLLNYSNIVISPETYPLGVGYLCLINCKNVTLQDLTLTRNGPGLLLANTSDSRISDNNVTANWDGIDLYFSCDNNTLSGNTVTANSESPLYVGSASGIYLGASSGNVLSSNNVTANNLNGIWLDTLSDRNTLSGNTVTANIQYGIEITDNSGNILFGNTVTANSWNGIFLMNSSGNTFYYNSFLGNTRGLVVNTQQVRCDGSPNTWDNGYPSGGNYWSDYTGVDMKNGLGQNQTGSDGIGDTPYVIGSNNTDYYPLMGVFNSYQVPIVFELHQFGTVTVISNSTITSFHPIMSINTLKVDSILFNVTGKKGSTGFCRVSIPTAIMNGTLEVFVNDTKILFTLLPCSNSTISYLYFTYTHSTEQVIILPEFPSSLILPIFTIIMLLGTMISKRKRNVKAK